MGEIGDDIEGWADEADPGEAEAEEPVGDKVEEPPGPAGMTVPVAGAVVGKAGASAGEPPTLAAPRRGKRRDAGAGRATAS